LEIPAANGGGGGNSGFGIQREGKADWEIEGQKEREREGV